MKKKAGTVLKAVIIVVVVIAATYLIWNYPLRSLIYPDFFSNAKSLDRIPDLKDGFVPQGVTYFEQEGCRLICGYMPDDRASRIYKLYDDGTVKRIDLKREDGSVYTGHAGGITAAGDYVYVSNQSKLFVIDAGKLKDALSGESLAFEGFAEVPCNSSFCSSDGEYVYVGEYHAKGYDTDETHVFKVKGGNQAALVFRYRLGNGKYGLEDLSVPDAAYSIRDNVQGFAFIGNGRCVASCSSGLSDSGLYVYNAPKEAASYLALSGEGKAVKAAKEGEAGAFPLYYLDTDSLEKCIKAPHMSEDLEYRNSALLINFEAGAKKFGLGLLPISITRLVSLNIQ